MDEMRAEIELLKNEILKIREEMKEMKEVKEVKEIKEEVKEVKKVKEKVVKDKKEKENTLEIIIIRNAMLNYINENAYKICCCQNYETTLKKNLKNYIEPCVDIRKISIKNLPYETVKEKIKKGKEMISEIFREEILLNYDEKRYISTVIISKENLKKRISELERRINPEMKEEEYEIELKENVRPEIFKEITYELIKTEIKKIKYDIKENYDMTIYASEIFNYYGEKIYCIDINKKIPNSTYTLLSTNETINYKKINVSMSLECVLLFITVKMRKLFYIPESGDVIFIKIEEKLDEYLKELNEILKDTKTKEELTKYLKANYEESGKIMEKMN